MKKYYIAYGSNLDIATFRYRCPNAQYRGITVLEGYNLAFKGDIENNGYLTIEENKGSSIPVAVFEITKSDEKSLDKYEGYPDFYYKKKIPIFMKNIKIEAFIYIMRDCFCYQMPSPDYLSSCFKGYNNFGFDTRILVEALRASSEKIRGGRK